MHLASKLVYMCRQDQEEQLHLIILREDVSSFCLLLERGMRILIPCREYIWADCVEDDCIQCTLTLACSNTQCLWYPGVKRQELENSYHC